MDPVHVPCLLRHKGTTLEDLVEQHVGDAAAGGDETSNGESDSQGTSESDGESEEGDDTEEDDDNEEDDVGEDREEVADNIAYRNWVQQARETPPVRALWEMKFQKYLQEGMCEDDARAKATMKTTWAAKKVFFSLYQLFLANHMRLETNETHQQIVNKLQQRISNGLDLVTSFKRVIAKHKSEFDELFDDDDDELDTDGAEGEANMETV